MAHSATLNSATIIPTDCTFCVVRPEGKDEETVGDGEVHF